MKREKPLKNAFKSLSIKFKNRIRELSKKDPCSGVSFVEVLVTLAIIAILMTTIAIAIIPWINEANITTAKQHIATFETAITMYLAKNRAYPDSLENIKSFLQESKIPKDPWGQPYQYTKYGDNEDPPYEIKSTGPDTQDGGDDDISSYEKTEDEYEVNP